MGSRQSSDGTKSSASRRFLRSYLRPFETSPLEDALAAGLAVGGFGLVALTLWLGGSAGFGFDRRPDVGGYGWLLIGPLLLAAALSARWANRRVVEQGERAVFLWLRVRRQVDDGPGPATEDRPDNMPILILALGSSSVGVTMSSLWTNGYYFDTSPIPWLVTAAWLAATAVLTIWMHRRVLASPASTRGIEYIRDGQAKAAAAASSLFLALAMWTAGLAGIPTTASGHPLVLPIMLVLAVVSIQASVTRTKHLANAQAPAAKDAEPAQNVRL